MGGRPETHRLRRGHHGEQMRNDWRPTLPLALILVCLLFAACGDDDPRGPGRDADVAGDAGGDGASSTDTGGDAALPEECEVSVERADECVDSTVGPTTVLCEGAPIAMILTLECEYLFTDVTARRNVYCCP